MRSSYNRDDFIHAAFRVWGKDLFGKMSLQDLTDDLGVTKPSLYRHFRSKDDLIHAMIDRTMEYHRFEQQELIRLTQTEAPFNDRLAAAVERHLELSLENLDLIHFSGYIYRKEPETAREMERLNDETFEMIAENLGVPVVAVQYLYTLLVLVIFLGQNLERDGECRLVPPDRETFNSRMPGRVGEILGMFYRGFKGDRYGQDPDYNLLCRRLEDFDFTTILEDRILKAAYEALMEEGDLVTSLSRVAEKAGLKKSSLYSHFKSKEEMLGQAILEMKRKYLDASSRFTGSFDRVEDKILAHLLFSTMFIRRFPETIEVMDKLVSMDVFRDQDPGDVSDSDFVALLDEAMTREILAAGFLDAERLNYFLSMITIIVVRYIRYHPQMTDRDRDEHIIRLYRIFIHGLEEYREVL